MRTLSLERAWHRPEVSSQDRAEAGSEPGRAGSRAVGLTTGLPCPTWRGLTKRQRCHSLICKMCTALARVPRCEACRGISGPVATVSSFPGQAKLWEQSPRDVGRGDWRGAQQGLWSAASAWWHPWGWWHMAGIAVRKAPAPQSDPLRLSPSPQPLQTRTHCHFSPEGVWEGAAVFSVSIRPASCWLLSGPQPTLRNRPPTTFTRGESISPEPHGHPSKGLSRCGTSPPSPTPGPGQGRHGVRGRIGNREQKGIDQQRAPTVGRTRIYTRLCPPSSPPPHFRAGSVFNWGISSPPRGCWPCTTLLLWEGAYNLGQPIGCSIPSRFSD